MPGGQWVAAVSEALCPQLGRGCACDRGSLKCGVSAAARCFSSLDPATVFSFSLDSSPPTCALASPQLLRLRPPARYFWVAPSSPAAFSLLRSQAGGKAPPVLARVGVARPAPAVPNSHPTLTLSSGPSHPHAPF